MQVLALITHPPLLESNDFPEDVKQRARDILHGCKGRTLDNVPKMYFMNAKVGHEIMA